MNRIARALGIALLFLAGYLAGQSDPPKAADASAWADFCEYTTATRTLSGGGSYTTVSAVVADWDSFSQQWRSVIGSRALNAVGSYDCKRG